MRKDFDILAKFIVGRIYCFYTRLWCRDRKPVDKQFIEEACANMTNEIYLDPDNDVMDDNDK